MYTETSGVCSAHLINGGLTVTDDRTVTLDWQATGPTPALRVPDDQLLCTLTNLDTGASDHHPSCTSVTTVHGFTGVSNYNIL